MKLKILLFFSAVFLCGSLFGRDQTVIFKFKAGDDGFFTGYGGNRAELEELYRYIDLYKSEILDGKLPIHVASWCNATNGTDREADLKLGSIRLNRVKTDLIEKKGLNESCFVSMARSYAFESMNNAVIVTLTVPTTKPVEQKPVVEEKKPEPPKPVEQKPIVEEKKPVEKQAEPVIEEKPELVYANKTRSGYSIALSSNLLYDIAALPNLGIEWKPADNFGILLNGAFSKWDFENNNKHHRIWMISPELRYYTGENKRFYFGVMFHAGEVNMKFSDTGYQGNYMGGGIVFGYKILLSNVFDLDFGLGLGCTRAEYDSYTYKNGINVVKTEGKTKDIWGPTKAGITLVWKIR